MKQETNIFELKSAVNLVTFAHMCLQCFSPYLHSLKIFEFYETNVLKNIVKNIIN